MRFLLGRRDMRFAFVVAFFSSLLVPTAAGAFCRTTTDPLPPSYNPSKLGCFTDGLFLYWKNACVSFAINEQASRSIPFDVAQRIIDESFGTWASVDCSNGSPVGIAISDIGGATCGEITYHEDGANQNLIVFRDDDWPYSDPNNTLGLTTVTFNADTGEIYDADMEINNTQQNLSTTDQVPSNGFDLASVVTHEAGHFLGLAHATDKNSTMYASYTPGSAKLRSLTADDIAGVCSIYPSPSIRSVSLAVSASKTVSADTCDATPRHGFSSECWSPKTNEKCEATPKPTASWAASGSVGVALAAILMARRRRR